MNDSTSSIPQPAPVLTADPALMKKMEAEYRLTKQLTSGASWFYWIAGLTVVNTALSFFGGEMSFVNGLGTTQIIDAIAMMLIQDAGEGAATLIRGLNIFFDLGLILLFVAFGFFAGKGHKWAFIVGMIAFFLDTLIFLIGPDIISILFHAVALYGLFTGFQAIGQLKKLKYADSVIQPV